MQAKRMKTQFLGKGHNWLYTLNNSSWYSFGVYFKWKKKKCEHVTLMAMKMIHLPYETLMRKTQHIENM